MLIKFKKNFSGIREGKNKSNQEILDYEKLFTMSTVVGKVKFLKNKFTFNYEMLYLTDFERNDFINLYYDINKKVIGFLPSNDVEWGSKIFKKGKLRIPGVKPPYVSGLSFVNYFRIPIEQGTELPLIKYKDIYLAKCTINEENRNYV